MARVDVGVDDALRDGLLCVGPEFASLPTWRQSSSFKNDGSRLDHLKAKILGVTVDVLKRSRQASLSGAWLRPPRKRGRRFCRADGAVSGEEQAAEDVGFLAGLPGCKL